MDLTEKSSRQTLIPSFLYTSSSAKTFALEKMLHARLNAGAGFTANVEAVSQTKGLVIPSPTELSNKIEMYSLSFYAACTVGGILNCGLTHMVVTPLNLVKCNMQIDPAKYKGISSGFGVLLKEMGAYPPCYSGQGACKFGFYEFLKKYYSDLAGPEFTAKYKTLIYLARSAFAEVIADVALCPFEAVKVRVQTQPGFARGLPGSYMSYGCVAEMKDYFE
ncbi:hypothetical protein M0R45_025683 [Rubus argutus]|uniref:Mitochondrial phosphate carrier protein n=1 Tax=Rubus argutus TaxID=59490 RepID=A0AAW1WVB7_RUBAR